jgi:hypothetical protein
VFRWPVVFTPLSLGSDGSLRGAILAVAPRVAAFTLAALSHLGHPAHLALIDAYLKGQVRLTPTATIGEDSQLVASSLAVPLLAAHELGVERLSLADLHLLPREEHPARQADRSADGHPTFTADSPRLLMRVFDCWYWVRGAERFEGAGCLGSSRVGLGDPWVRVVAALPDGAEIESSVQAGRWPAPILAEVRAPSADDTVSASSFIVRERAMALARWAGATVQETQLAGAAFGPAAGRIRSMRTARPAQRFDDFVSGLTGPVEARRPLQTSLVWHGLEVEVMLRPDFDGYQTLCLLPPADADPSALFETMGDLTWSTVEGLIGRPLPERRTERIALRLIVEDGRSTTLDVGASVVIGRNQTVFTAWVGSDGRVMLKLFPPGGMRAG